MARAAAGAAAVGLETVVEEERAPVGWATVEAASSHRQAPEAEGEAEAEVEAKAGVVGPAEAKEEEAKVEAAVVEVGAV